MVVELVVDGNIYSNENQHNAEDDLSIGEQED
jgi:hypothetical protein